MKRCVPCLLAMCLAVALGGCTSVPIQFYTLMPPPAPVHDTVSAPYAIAVLPVTIPAQVDRPELVVREGDSSVALLDGQRWIAPLGDEIRNALAADLAHVLGVQDVYAIGADKGTPIYRVKVDIKRFESVPGQYTLLAATWDVDRAGGKASPATPCTIHIKQNVGQGYAALAEGHQRGLQALAALIAADIRGAVQGHAIHCPSAAS